MDQITLIAVICLYLPMASGLTARVRINFTITRAKLKLTWVNHLTILPHAYTYRYRNFFAKLLGQVLL
jgi:hypothetical protein